jgi:glutathione peroxidase-family protein
MKLKQILAAAAFAGGLAMAAHAEGPTIGAAAPDFTLTDTNGKAHKLSSYKGKTVVLEWTNFGCPFVAKHYDSNHMQGLQKKWTDKGIVWLSINSSAQGTEGNMTAGDWNSAIKNVRAHSTAFLLDEDGTVGHLYDAKTTPDMFIVDPNGTLIYKGAIDDKPSTKQKDLKGAKNYVDIALTELAAGKPVTTSTTDSYGCSIKYKQ